jgi:nitroreductase
MLGIARGDTDAMHRQHARNFSFFDAPVGLIFTIDRRLEIGSWLDYGMFLQNIMVAARVHGLETCVQAAFAPVHRTIRSCVPIPEGEIVVCGMSIGYADPAAPENALETDREPARDFATFLGWEPTPEDAT